MFGSDEGARKLLRDEDLIYNESCLFTLLNISVSMEAFFTMATIFYLNWNSSDDGEDIYDQKMRVIRLGTPLLYKKHFINQ